MNSLFRMGLGAVLTLTLLAVTDARAQQVGSPAGATWYNYVPGQGWVGYNPASAPATSSGSVASYTPAPSVAPSSGWTGYNPAAAWVGYAPASARLSRPIAMNSQRQFVLPADGSRRRAASLFVNRSYSQLSLALPAYEETGSGRRVPLIKPWLPLQP